MSDVTPQFTAPPEAPAVDQSTADGGTTTEPDPKIDFKDRFEAQQKVNRDLERKLKATEDSRAELAALKAQVEGREAEHKATLDAQRVKDEALSAANQRILKAEVRAAAAGKLNDPQDALRFLDLSGFEVGPDGDVDGETVAAAIDDLLKNKPYLAAQGVRFQGGADGGARKGPVADIDGQIAAATAAGQHLLAIQLKQQRAAQLANKS